MTELKYPFFTRLAEILNSDQSRSVILSGNVYDLYFNGTEYVPLIPFVADKSGTSGLIRMVYELNGPIRIIDDRERIKNAWIAWKSGVDTETLVIRGMRARGESEYDLLAKQFDQLLLDAIGNPTLALETMRQLTIASRSNLSGNLMILIEAADMLLPMGNGDLSSLNDKQLHRISICQDWFSDPAFMQGGDSVIMVAESSSLIHARISQLPQVVTVEAAAPTKEARLHFINHYCSQAQFEPKLWGSREDLAAFTAGVSVHALRQLLLRASYTREILTPADLIEKVQEFIQSQLGEDVVEFKKPSHRIDQLKGNSKLKAFIRGELLPRFKAPPEKALTGAAVAGPMGG